MVDRALSKAKNRQPGKSQCWQSNPWWKTLKVSDTASLEEVAIAFRELAMQFHPDLWTNATEDQRKVADSRMKMINAAFEKQSMTLTLGKLSLPRLNKKLLVGLGRKLLSSPNRKPR